MTFREFVQENSGVLLICGAGGLFLTFFLYFFGLGAAEIILLWICFVMTVGCCFGFRFWSTKKRLDELEALMDSLDRKYLFAQIADAPVSVVEKKYFAFLQAALKSMSDEIAQNIRQQEEYREFVEQWVHEIKVPVTGINLICENDRNENTRKILAQTERVEQDVELVLFYARLGKEEKDFLVKEVDLNRCVQEALGQNKQLLIGNGVRAETDGVRDRVYSDEKWLVFILNQLLSNSVKYRSHRPPVIRFASESTEQHIIFTVTDNGRGIRESEIQRVFEKGFVGSNGRAQNRSTGLGLYLCRQFCARLGIGITIASKEGEYTSVSLYFPRGETEAAKLSEA